MEEDKFRTLALLDLIDAVVGIDTTEMRLDLEISEMTGCKLLTNMEARDRQHVLDAVAMTGMNIFIESEAWSRDGSYVVGGHIGIWTRDIYRDHSDFWKVLNYLRNRRTLIVTSTIMR